MEYCVCCRKKRTFITITGQFKLCQDCMSPYHDTVWLTRVALHMVPNYVKAAYGRFAAFQEFRTLHQIYSAAMMNAGQDDGDFEFLKDTSASEVFSMYCNWNGLINYGDMLWTAVQQLQGDNRDKE